MAMISYIRMRTYRDISHGFELLPVGDQPEHATSPSRHHPAGRTDVARENDIFAEIDVVVVEFRPKFRCYERRIALQCFGASGRRDVEDGRGSVGGCKADVSMVSVDDDLGLYVEDCEGPYGVLELLG